MASDIPRRQHSLGVPTLVDDAEVARTATYPHLVVRIYSTVYQRERIQVRRGPAAVGVHSGATYVQHPEPLANGEMSEGCRTLLLAGVQEAVRRLKFRMCVVWSPKACSYVETDAINHCAEPPSGGLALPNPIDIQTWKAIEDQVLVVQTGIVIH